MIFRLNRNLGRLAAVSASSSANCIARRNFNSTATVSFLRFNSMNSSTCLQRHGVPRIPSFSIAERKCQGKMSVSVSWSVSAQPSKSNFVRPHALEILKNRKGGARFLCSNRKAGEGTEENGESKVEDVCEGEGTKAKVRVQRRRGTAVISPESADLLSVPGIGLRNMQKLVEKGIGKLSDLKQLYRDRFLRHGSERMVEYLRSSVGIIHKNHAESITSYIRDSVDQELENETLEGGEKKLPKKRLTFCVEGNISVGKTTFLQRIANETIELRDLVEVVPEPISKWQDVGPEHFNVLNAFYTEPHRYAYTFQNYVFVTRVMQEQESSRGIKPLRLMERSVFSDRMVFVRAVHEAKWMNEMELSIYDSWFDPVVSALPGLVPDGFIYLRASPDTCHKRMHLRQRAEEVTVSLKYLQDLHEKHENWLFPAQCSGHGVLSVSHLPSDLDKYLDHEIKDRIMLLQGDHVHSRIQKVPALILDYEPTIDFSRDTEAKRAYARQIADFFEFVKKMKGQTSDKEILASKKVMLPQAAGGLIGPDGKILRAPLNPPEFWQSMSA
eukprot:TRINITY_DN12751_c0_g1_i1.p1 TRINITY_DN12751_c0_g1~~TRINITY_DN12751_c0_g1_i1.p1  ORF type:complete len:556 (+),score=88.72 TRINITY_DN12751_c0_g1_i1:234-1901(+)